LLFLKQLSAVSSVCGSLLSTEGEITLWIALMMLAVKEFDIFLKIFD
jgi:hypothetical protein